MSCQNSDNDMETFRNSDIPSFEMHMEDMDNYPFRVKDVFSNILSWASNNNKELTSNPFPQKHSLVGSMSDWRITMSTRQYLCWSKTTYCRLRFCHFFLQRWTPNPQQQRHCAHISWMEHSRNLHQYLIQDKVSPTCMELKEILSFWKSSNLHILRSTDIEQILSCLSDSNM